MRSIFLGLKNISNFGGRTTRSEFWPFCLFAIILYFAFGFMTAIYVFSSAVAMEQAARAASPDHSISPAQMEQMTQALVVMILKTATLPAFGTIAVMASAVTRRLHDTGKSGLLVFSFLLVMLGHLFLMFFAGPEIVNNPAIKPWAQAAIWGAGAYEVAVLFMLLIAMVRESEPRDNAYGPNPYPLDFEPLKRSIQSIGAPDRAY